ncbi:MAG: hypothetical protein IKK75_02270 [Clostridia bacterium]|nr:hypothetical protein [Clostridia bacterium]
MAAAIPMFYSMPVEDIFAVASDQPSDTKSDPRRVNEIIYSLPELDYQQQIFTREMLSRGKMLLVDQSHLLPDEALAPNCFSIAKYANGMVPVKSLTIKTGAETIGALERLFDHLRRMGITDLYVARGTMSEAEQKEAIVQKAKKMMENDSASEAIKLTLDAMDWPGTGEYCQEYTVEIRMMNTEPENLQLLDYTSHGQTLLHLAWRYGFVRPDSAKPFCFRYVGTPHATAMTYLNLSYADYLEWLHQKGCIAIREEGKIKYLILCKQMEGSHIAFDLPVGCNFEASLDNLGYALVACTL